MKYLILVVLCSLLVGCASNRGVVRATATQHSTGEGLATATAEFTFQF